MKTIPIIETKKLLSTQGTVLKDLKKGQVHFMKTEETEDKEFFALVLNVENDFCDVVPGCFDAMKAGPDDIFLEENVLGECVMLCLDKMCTVKKDCVDKGFATLNTDIYNKIVDAISKYEDGLTDVGFNRGHKYLSENDPRLKLHRRLCQTFAQ